MSTWTEDQIEEARFMADDDGCSTLARRRYQSQLWAHPDCRDPDHPGCDKCEDQDDLDPEDPDEGCV